MNLRQWNRNHTLGLLVGIVLPILFIPVIIAFMAWAQNFYFQQLWFKFFNSSAVMSKILTLAILANLGVFYVYLNREKYHFAAGIIVGSLLYLPVVVYFLFFK
ncbi:MAG: hypothetical protein WC044_08120 [Crocinitomicaceae bacterium]